MEQSEWEIRRGRENCERRRTRLRDDAGRLDSEKVENTITNVVAERPSWRRPGISFDGGARATAPARRQPGLADLLKPEARR
jgi:hypothetical protein